MRKIFCLTIVSLVIIGIVVPTIAVSAVSYADLKPTYSQSSDYSDYVNLENDNGPIDDRLQFRSNCYGYVLRVHYGDGENLQRFFSYGQLAGEFYDKTSIQMSFDDLMDMYDENKVDTGRKFDEEMVYSFVLLDCRTLGYSAVHVDTYDNDESFVPPSASASTNRRLVALVGMDSGDDIHFYMQHDDNTWSHKPADGPATSKCLECNEELDNSNISDHIHCRANTSQDYDGKVILFSIIAPGSSDRTHGDGHIPNNPFYPYYTPIGLKDIPGDYLCSALHIDNVLSGTLNGKINYIDDEDYYIFDVSTSGSYNFSFTKDTYAYRIYVGEVAIGFSMTNTTVKALTVSTSSVSFTKTLQAGKRYYIKVIAYGQTLFDPDVMYHINVS